MRNKKEPFRIIVGIVSILFIIFMWVKKDILAIYTTAPKEQIVPILVTTIAVTFLKVILIAGAVMLVKLIFIKFKNK